MLESLTNFSYVMTPVPFALVDFRSADGRDYDSLFRAFEHDLATVDAVTLTIDNADFADDMYAGRQFLLVGSRMREALDEVQADVRLVPAIVHCRPSRRDITGRYWVAPISTWVPLLDEQRSEFEPFRSRDGSVRKMMVNGEEITAVRKLLRGVFRSDLNVSAKVFGNAYGSPRAAPFFTEDLVTAVKRRRCGPVEFLDPEEL